MEINSLVENIKRKFDGNSSEKRSKASLKEDLLILETYGELYGGKSQDYLDKLYARVKAALAEADNDESDEEDFNEDEGDFEDNNDTSSDEEDLEFSTDFDQKEGELSPGEETFPNKYPDVDVDTVLLKAYDEFILSISEKPFYKTIAGFYERWRGGSLNFMERQFLFRFMKATSSALTHLIIESEQKEESLCLLEKYFDSLIECLNKVVHARDKDDVIQSFRYMIDFLGISQPEETPPDADEDF